MRWKNQEGHRRLSIRPWPVYCRNADTRPVRNTIFRGRYWARNMCDLVGKVPVLVWSSNTRISRRVLIRKFTRHGRDSQCGLSGNSVSSPFFIPFFAPFSARFFYLQSLVREAESTRWIRVDFYVEQWFAGPPRGRQLSQRYFRLLEALFRYSEVLSPGRKRV